MSSVKPKNKKPRTPEGKSNSGPADKGTTLYVLSTGNDAKPAIWLKTLALHGAEKFSQSCLRLDGTVIPEEEYPWPPSHFDEGDLHTPYLGLSDELANSVYLSNRKAVDARREESKNAAGKIIAHGLIHCAQDLKEALLEEYPSMHVERDLVKFRAAVLKCCRKEYGKPIEDLQTEWQFERGNFRRTGQFSGETEAAYKLRYTQLLERGAAIDCVLSDYEQAEDYIAGLGPMWESLQLDRANKKAAGLGLPEGTAAERAAKKAVVNIPRTLADAYKQVQSWALPQSSTIDFMVNAATVNRLEKELAKMKEKKSPNPKRGKGSKENKPAAPAPAPTPPKVEKADRPPSQPCMICREMHWTKNCPEIEFVNKVIADKKAASGASQASSTRGESRGASASGGGRPHVNYSTLTGADVWADRSGGHAREGRFINFDVDTHVSSPAITRSLSCASINLASSHLTLLDRCASDTTFKSEALIRNVRDIDPMLITTIFGTGSVNKSAESVCFGEVYFDSNAPFNVLCQHVVERMWTCTDFKHDGVLYRTEVYIEPLGLTLVFEIVNNVLVGDLSPLVNRKFITPPKLRPARPDLAIAAPTVSDMADAELVKASIEANRQKQPPISARQLKQAEKARQVQRNLLFMSADDVRKSVSNGWIDNTDISPNDVRRADEFLGGKDEALLKGKSHAQKAVVQNLEDGLLPGELVAYVDLFKTMGSYYFFGTVTPGSHTQVIPLGNNEARATRNLKGPLVSFLNFYKPFDMSVKVISADGECGLKVLEPVMNQEGAQFVPRAKGTGVPVADNKIKVVKERIRCVVNALKFVVAAFLFPFLVSYVVSMLNYTPTSTNVNGISPNAFIFSRAGALPVPVFDYKKIAPAFFGDYCLVADGNRSNTRNLVDKPRMISAIYAGPVNELGTYRFISIATMKPFTREHFSLSPMTDVVLARLNDVAKAGSTPPETTELGDDGGADDGDPPDDPPQQAPDPGQRNIRTPGRESAFHTPQRSTAERVGVSADDFVPSPPMERQPPSEPRSTSQPTPMDLSAEIEGAFERRQDFEYLRRSDRRNRGVNPRFHGVNMTVLNYEDIKHGVSFASTMTFRKALQNYGEDATQALVAEIDGILKRKVWHGVLYDSLSSTQRKKLIRSSIIVSEKFKSGVFDRLKARIVGGGDQQDKSLYKESEISSPTVATTSVFSAIATAAAKRYNVVTFDIGQAYLNADMSDEVYVVLDSISANILCQLDPSYTQYLKQDGKLIVRLDKALYGCVTSAREWYDCLKNTLTGLGYSVNEYDPCVFTKPAPSGGFTTVCFHVDDGLATSPDASELKQLIEDMKSAFKEIKFVYGDTHEYLGMLLDFSVPGQCELTMRKYIADLVEDFGVTGTARTPATLDLFDVDEYSPLLSADLKERFHRGTAQCLYLATHVRPDILCAVSFLTTRVQAPTEQDSSKLFRLIRYLNATRELGMVLGEDEDGNYHLSAYVDASFGVHVDGKSHTGMFITLGRGPILAKSLKQKHVTKSSCEAELVALSDIASLFAWQQEWMTSMGLADDAYPGYLYEDNTSAIRLAENGRSTSDRTKHIRLRYFFIKQYLDNGDFVLKHCSTDRMIADILTKPLQGAQFEFLRKYLLGYAAE